MTFKGTLVNATQTLERGLSMDVVAPEHLTDRAYAGAREVLAAEPTDVGTAKQLYAENVGAVWLKAATNEVDGWTTTVQTEELFEGMRVLKKVRDSGLGGRMALVCCSGGRSNVRYV